jgi:sulfate adenylyltransferase (ADP) / ATP adenylyltransferase
MMNVDPSLLIQNRPILEPGTLWKQVVDRSDQAITCGALKSIPTGYEFVEQEGIRFLVRIFSNLDRKQKAKEQQEKISKIPGKNFNPFLPYEKDLFVANISDTHLFLLNKFNVVDHHLLIITRSFEEQENWLTLRDFEAMWVGLAEFESLAFYNGGAAAGASQRHKHLQMIPLPMVPDGVHLPIDPAIADARFRGTIGTVPDFPFVHAIAKLDPAWGRSPGEAAQETLALYWALLDVVGLSHHESNSNQQTGAYNLLATRQWMLIVPRSQESFASIAVNSLGFAGALLVRDAQQMKQLKTYSPLKILQNVSLIHEDIWNLTEKRAASP